MTNIYKIESFISAFTIEQVQTDFDQAINSVKTGKSPTILCDDQPVAILFSFKEALELLRARHTVPLDGLLSCAARKCPTGRTGAVYGRH